jgi:hypothetical protein
MRDELLHAYLITLRNAVLGERRPDCRTWLNAARVVRLAEEYVRSREDELGLPHLLLDHDPTASARQLSDGRGWREYVGLAAVKGSPPPCYR